MRYVVVVGVVGVVVVVVVVASDTPLTEMALARLTSDECSDQCRCRWRWRWRRERNGDICGGRTKDEADPDPNPYAVAFRTFRSSR